MSHQHFQTISHNLFFLKDFFSKIPAVKPNILRHDWRKFESNTFISDLDQTDWEQLLCTEKSDVHFSMNQYLSKIDSLLEIHATLKTLNKNELKFLTKPMITQSLQNSIKRKIIYTQNLQNVNTKSLKNFITISTRPTEIFCLHTSKGQKKT